jgi:cystathionine beta-lyase family protein involved in aluminum resistance
LRTERHLNRVLSALRDQRVGSSELNGGLDGYAHGDLGREAIDGKSLRLSSQTPATLRNTTVQFY